MACIVHTDRMRLHDGGVGIHVDDKSRKIISFSMHQSICIVVLHSGKFQCLAQCVSDTDAFFPESGIYRDGLKDKMRTAILPI